MAPEDLIKLDGIGPKTAENIIAAAQRAVLNKGDRAREILMGTAKETEAPAGEENAAAAEDSKEADAEIQQAEAAEENEGGKPAEEPEEPKEKK